MQCSSGKILYFGEGTYIADLFLPVALAMRRLCPDIESRFIDMSITVRRQAPTLASGAPRFREMGFAGEDFSLQTVNSWQGERVRSLLAIQGILSRLKPQAVVVPHELGYAFDVVQLANLLGIPTYHLQHAIWPAYRLGAEPVITSACRWSEPTSPGSKPTNPRSKLPTFVSDVAYRQLQIVRDELRLLKRLASEIIGFLLKLLSSNKHKGLPPESRLLDLPPDIRLLLSRHPSNIVYKCTVKKIGATGAYYKKRFEALGTPEKGVDIVGFTRTDWFLTQPLESKEVLGARYDLDPNRPLALYMYSSLAPSDLANGDAIEALSDAIHALRYVNPDISVLVLVHPQGDMSRIARAVNSLQLKGIRVNRAHLDHYSLYRAADVILGVDSATLVEATLAGRPIVIQNYVLCNVRRSWLIEGGAVIPVFHRIHLQDQIERALKDRPFVERVIANQAHVAHDLMGSFDGKCGERAARSILRLAGVKGV